MSNSKVEIQDIFAAYGEIYRKNYNLPISHLKAISAIENCRTAELCGHVDICDIGMKPL